MIEHHTACIIIEKDGKFLLGTRLNKPYVGYWSFIAGHVDDGESPFQAAQREANEEAGEVNVEKEELFSFVHDTRLGHRHIAHVFRGVVTGKVRAASDVGELGWFTVDEIADLDVTHVVNIVFNHMFPKISKPDYSRSNKE